MTVTADRTGLHLVGMSAEQILAALLPSYPELRNVLARAQRQVPTKKRQIAEYQAAALYALARPYDRAGARILEIGTFLGYSAAVLAQACPRAEIVTLNPNKVEALMAQGYLRPYRNVTVSAMCSWDFLDVHVRRQRAPYDLIFVDGDHARILKDLPWYDHLRPGGLFFHHDYAPEGTYRACPPVYEALNQLRDALGRDFDALVVDDGGVGMAGFIRRDEDAGWRELMP